MSSACLLIGDVFDRMAELEDGSFDLDCGHPDDDPTVWHTDGDDTVCSRCCPTCNGLDVTCPDQGGARASA